MKKIALIVTDAGPLITLALAGALDSLISTTASLYIPDMVRLEVVGDLSKPGAADVANWIRANEGSKLQITSTQVFEEFQILRAANPALKSSNRGEQAASEVLGKLLTDSDQYAALIFEDTAIRKQNFLVRLPDTVLILSTSAFLHGLERMGLFKNAEAVMNSVVEPRGEQVTNQVARMPDGEDAPNWSSDFGFGG